ncbi:HAMP domain-containing histidine kinase [Patescibacteria group bacterium]|nr:HAMP domain-containing histidine kinase [Patescibacteria group bacterium]
MNSNKNNINKNSEYIFLGKNIQGIVHNLKNEITPIYSVLDLLKNSKNFDEDTLDMLNIAFSSVSRINNLTDNILDIFKINNKTFNLNKNIKEIIKIFNFNLKFKHYINVNFIEKGSDIILCSLPDGFFQILMSLIENSFESIDLDNIKGEINIIIDGRENSFILEDNGSGIDWCINCNKENRSFNLCNEFYIGRTTKKEGNGVGMNYFQSFVNKMDWKTIISSTKKGTEIKINF